MKSSQLIVQDVSLSHSSVIPLLFPDARDLNTTPALLAVSNGQVPAQPSGFGLLASPYGLERSAYLFAIRMLEGDGDTIDEDQLLMTLIDTARRLRAPALENLKPVTHEAHRRLLERHGFNAIRRTITYHFSISKALGIFRDTLAALEAVRRIPEGVERIPYHSAAEYSRVSDLCQQAFGLLTHGHLQAAGEYPGGGRDFSMSAIYRQGDAMVGAWGIGIDDETAVFDPLLVSPGKRNTWVFPYIIHDSLARLAEQDIQRGIAQIHASNSKMLALMKRIGATPVEEEALYRLPLHRADEAGI